MQLGESKYADKVVLTFSDFNSGTIVVQLALAPLSFFYYIGF